MQLYPIEENLIPILDEDIDEYDKISINLNNIDYSFNDKSINISKYVNNISSDIKIIDEEINRLKELKIKRINKKNNLLNYLKENMEVLEIKKISCPLFSILLKDCPESVIVENEFLLSDEYMRTKIIKEIDKEKIKKEMKLGVLIDGVKLVKNKTVIIK